MTNQWCMLVWENIATLIIATVANIFRQNNAAYQDIHWASMFVLCASNGSVIN